MKLHVGHSQLENGALVEFAGGMGRRAGGHHRTQLVYVGVQLVSSSLLTRVPTRPVQVKGS